MSNYFPDFRFIDDDIYNCDDPVAELPKKWLPLIAGSQTPLPGTTVPHPPYSAKTPMRSTRLLMDYLSITCHLTPSERDRFIDLIDRRGRCWFPNKARRIYRKGAKIGQLQFHYDPSPKFWGTVAWLKVRPLLEHDKGPGQAFRTLKQLGYFLKTFGPLSRWRVSRIDIAVDYPAWVWDLLVIRPGVQGEGFAASSSDAITLYTGKTRGARVAQYWRAGKVWGHNYTRIERQYRKPTAGGKRLTLDGLLDLEQPFKNLWLRPMWGTVSAPDALGLRLLQIQGCHPLVMRWLDPRGTLTKTATKKAYTRLHREVARDPEALASVEQPPVVFEERWTRVARQALKAIRTGMTPPPHPLWT